MNPGFSQAPRTAMSLYLLQRDLNSPLLGPMGQFTFTGAQVFVPSSMVLL